MAINDILNAITDSPVGVTIAESSWLFPVLESTHVLAITFVTMFYWGVGLHKISLGSLIIALGLLVDDAIIAVEMMVRKLEEGYDKVRAATFAYEATAMPMLQPRSRRKSSNGTGSPSTCNSLWAMASSCSVLAGAPSKARSCASVPSRPESCGPPAASLRCAQPKAAFAFTCWASALCASTTTYGSHQPVVVEPIKAQRFMC